MVLGVIGGQKLNGGAINVIYHSVNQGLVGAYGIKNLTNIRVHIRDSMPKNLVKRLVM